MPTRISLADRSDRADLAVLAGDDRAGRNAQPLADVAVLADALPDFGGGTVHRDLQRDHHVRRVGHRQRRRRRLGLNEGGGADESKRAESRFHGGILAQPGRPAHNQPMASYERYEGAVPQVRTRKSSRRSCGASTGGCAAASRSPRPPRGSSPARRRSRGRSSPTRSCSGDCHRPARHRVHALRAGSDRMASGHGVGAFRRLFGADRRDAVVRPAPLHRSVGGDRRSWWRRDVRRARALRDGHANAT